jgi:hypothetical protein
MADRSPSPEARRWANVHIITDQAIVVDDCTMVDDRRLADSCARPEDGHRGYEAATPDLRRCSDRSAWMRDDEPTLPRYTAAVEQFAARTG